MIPTSASSDLDTAPLPTIEGPRTHWIDVTWARGLAGKRAPLSVGETQFAFVKAAMAARDGQR